MRASPQLVEFIKGEEGCVLKAYLCPGGHWTIGYGHTALAGPPAVTPGLVVSKNQADQILRRDLMKFEVGVERLVKVELTQYQFDALVSFAFNCGLGNLQKSTLLRVLNRGEYDKVPAQLMRWTRAAGRELKGLVKRRRAEAEIWRGLRWGGEDLADTNVAVEEATPDRAVPDEPATPPITTSREVGTAAAGGGFSLLYLWSEFKDLIFSGQFTSLLKSPHFIYPLLIVIMLGAIIYFRRQRQKEGA